MDGVDVIKFTFYCLPLKFERKVFYQRGGVFVYVSPNNNSTSIICSPIVAQIIVDFVMAVKTNLLL